MLAAQATVKMAIWLLCKSFPNELVYAILSTGAAALRKTMLVKTRQCEQSMIGRGCGQYLTGAAVATVVPTTLCQAFVKVSLGATRRCLGPQYRKILAQSNAIGHYTA